MLCLAFSVVCNLSGGFVTTLDGLASLCCYPRSSIGPSSSNPRVCHHSINPVLCSSSSNSIWLIVSQSASSVSMGKLFLFLSLILLIVCAKALLSQASYKFCSFLHATLEQSCCSEHKAPHSTGFSSVRSHGDSASSAYFLHQACCWSSIWSTNRSVSNVSFRKTELGSSSRAALRMLINTICSL